MKHIFILFPFFIDTYLFSQINGTILEESTLLPISNVNISTNTYGTVSNDNGTFLIKGVEGSVITFSHIGYEDKKESAKNDMVVYLTKDVLKLKEITVKSGLINESFSESTNSLTVIQQNDIRDSGADHLNEIVERISNLNWAGGTSRPRYFQIRGVGERSQYFGEGSPNFSIGYALDDIDLSGLGMLGHLFDLNQIEVFKGPQSSIFGSNSIGGLISLKSNKPSNKNIYRYSLTVGNDGKKGINGLINFKIIQSLLLRISSSYNYSNGFRKNNHLNVDNSNKKDEIFVRAKLLFAPSKHFSLLGTVISSDLKNGYDVWAPDNNDQFLTYSDFEGEDSQNTNAGSLKLNYQLSNNFFLKVISTFSATKQVHSYDGDWANDEYWLIEHGFDPDIEGWSYSFYDSNRRKRKNFSQEIRLSNKQYTFGGYFNKFNEKDKAQGYLFGGLADEAESEYEFQKLAAYFQSFFKISEAVKLDFSLRLEDYFYEYRGRAIDNYYYTNIPTVNFIQTKEDRNPMLGFRIALSYKHRILKNLFLSYARGYKAGGANQEPFLDVINRPYGPEFIDNFEFGFKTVKEKYMISFNGFYGLRTDQQVSVSSQQDLGNPNSFYFYTANSGRGFLKGFETEIRYKFLPSFETISSIGFLDTYVEEFSYQTSNGISYGGDRESAMAPQLTCSFGFRYDLGDIFLASNTSYKSSYYFSDSHNNKSEAYSLTNITLGQSFQKFDITLWLRNVFDEKYNTRGFYFGLIPPNYPEQLWKSYGDPRHFGVTIDYNVN